MINQKNQALHSKIRNKIDKDSTSFKNSFSINSDFNKLPNEQTLYQSITDGNCHISFNLQKEQSFLNSYQQSEAVSSSDLDLMKHFAETDKKSEIKSKRKKSSKRRKSKLDSTKLSNLNQEDLDDNKTPSVKINQPQLTEIKAIQQAIACKGILKNHEIQNSSREPSSNSKNRKSDITNLKSIKFKNDSEEKTHRAQTLKSKAFFAKKRVFFSSSIEVNVEINPNSCEGKFLKLTKPMSKEKEIENKHLRKNKIKGKGKEEP